ncbi:MAG: LPS assembly protein LptD [Gammaproteobacteria bacterium]|nr:LPS assembly protein LptD [Gammaproteobacteria bacterium]
MPDLIEIPSELRSAPPAGQSASLPIRIEADRIEVEDGNTVILHGNARVMRGRRGLYAERIEYDRDASRARARGNVVFYTARGDEVRADALDLEVNTWTGEAAAVAVKIADREATESLRAGGGAPLLARARGRAQSMRLEGADTQRLTGVSMTTCEPGNRAVVLNAREMVFDHARGFGTAKSVTVRLKGVPIFYFPTLTFPISDKRKTGFLFPSAGYTGKSGWMVAAPYYINLAPHYDATVTPRILSRRGAQIAGRFRYLSANGRGRVHGEWLPSDNAFDDQDRHALGYQHHHRFGRNWSADVNLQTVSDRDYVSDFSSEIETVASSYTARTARLEHISETLRFSARMAAHDPADRRILRNDRPYSRLPQLNLDWAPRGSGVVQARLEAEYTDFRHDYCGAVGGTPPRVKPCGTRLRVKPSLSAPVRRRYGYIEPKMSLQTIRYSLHRRDPLSRASPSVDVPVFSIDSGLLFERKLERGGAAYRQTLEPRLFYVNIPEKRAQRTFPNFDTDEGSASSFEHFFRENRFFGGDRVGDTEHLTVGLSGRIIDHSGRQRLKFGLGQIIYLQDRVLGASADAKPATEDVSGWFAEFDAALSGRWHANGFARRNERGNGFDWFRLAADYRSRERRSATLAYTFKDAAGEQVNAAFATPPGRRWRLKASGAYSLREDEIRAAAIGVDFNGCCWAIRAVAQRYLDGDGDHKNRLVLTLELNALGNSRM